MLFHIGVVLLIELLPQAFHRAVAGHLGSDQRPQGLADASHPLDTREALVAELGLLGPLGIRRQLNGAALAGGVRQPAPQLPVVLVVAAFGDGRVVQRFHGAFYDRLGVHLRRGLVDAGRQVLQRLLQQLPGVLAGARHERRLVRAVHGASLRPLAEQHARVFGVVAVGLDRLAAARILDIDGVHPALHVLARRQTAPLGLRQLLEEHDVGRYFGAGVLGKGVVRQAHCAKEARTLANVDAGSVVCRIKEAV